MFIPSLYASQPCEEILRRMRSMGTCNYTKINFTLHEFLHMIARIEMMFKINFASNNIVFPRMDKKLIQTETAVQIELPSNEQIIETIKRAQNDALKEAARFNIHFTTDDINKCEIKLPDSETILNAENDDSCQDSDSDVDRDEVTKISKPSPVIELIDENGMRRNIRKSRFIWNLTEYKDKLSADRLKRVQSSTDGGNSSSKRRKIASSKKSNNNSNEKPYFYKADDLEIGEWAIFTLLVKPRVNSSTKLK